MSDATIFYILGGLLAAMAVTTSFVGLRFESFPGRYGPAIFLCFFLVAASAITFAIRNGQNEEKARAAENTSAGEEIEKKESESPSGASGGEAGGGESSAAAKPKGPGGTLALAASPTELAFNKKSLTSKPGKVMINMTNPAAIEHDIGIEKNGELIAVSETVSEGKTSVSAELAPGTYTFLCTVPGHAEAGMEGTLVVK